MGSASQALNRPEWLTDERFSTPSARDRHVDERLQMTQEVLLTRTAAEWLKILEEMGVPCAPALKRGEVINFSQVRASGSLVEYQHHAAGQLRQTRPPARFEKTPAEIRRGAPLLGEHNLEVLTEIGLSPGEIDRMSQIAEKVAVHSVGRRVPPKPATKGYQVLLRGALLPGSATFGSVTAANVVLPLQWFDVRWAK
jgi:crotonobetainyl-CoA:carnitine CoA-transferase CaiB-like acyl-CoA transferase